MYGPGDVQFFTRLSRIYDLVMPAANEAAIDAGLSSAERPVNRVLDVGGGSGRATVATGRADSIVVDISAGMLSRAQARGLASIRGDARRLPISDRSVDAVLIVDAFHHMPDGEVVLDEIVRVLRPGGVIVIREFDPSRLLGRTIELSEHAIGMQSTFYTPTRLAYELAERGLDVSTTDNRLGYTAIGVLSVDASQ